MDKLTVWMTTQAPHAIRTVFALVAGHVGLAEHKIRIISPDIGGGFGGKVPVYPGYVIAVAASVLTGKPVKWIEDRMENLQADSFARDYHITAELAAKKDGTLTALRIKTLADHGYTDAAANPSKFPAGLFHVCTGSYDLKAAHVEVDGAYTNKPPGGIAYRCSFRVTEAVHTIERMVDLMAHQLNIDPAEFRMKNFVKPEQFPYKSALGWEYDSGNYAGALTKAMDMIGYADLRREQAEKRKRGQLMGIGISSFTEIVGAGPSKHFDILGLEDVRQLRDPHSSDRQGHRALRHEVAGPGPRDDVRPDPGRGARHPGARTSRSRRATPTPRPTASAPTRAARRRSPAPRRRSRRARCATRRGRSPRICSRSPRTIWCGSPGKFSVKGAPGKSKTIQDIAFAAYTNHPQGMEAGLEAVSYYDPPNLTYPFGSYICVVDVDSGTGEVKVRRFVAIDDCGNIINPMIVQGQVHGGLTMGLAPALFEEISYDETGNIQGGSFIDYLLPTAMETPKWETGPHGHALAAPSARRQGRRRIGNGRRAGRHRQRGGRRALASGRAPHRHPDHAREGVEAPAREGRDRVKARADVADELIALAAELQRSGEAFALATVVRCEAPTSAKPGAKALIREDGRVQGWVGGACAEPVVAREALQAMRDGRPATHRPLRRGRAHSGPDRRDAGVRNDVPQRWHAGDLRGALSAQASARARRPRAGRRDAWPRSGAPRTFTVVTLVADTLQTGLEQPAPH